MDSHKLDQRVTLQALVTDSPPVDDYGAPAQTWTDVAELWAQVTPQSGREFIAGQAEHAALLYKVAIRHRPGLTAAMRLIWQGRVLDLVAPPARFGRRDEGLMLTCKESA